MNKKFLLGRAGFMIAVVIVAMFYVSFVKEAMAIEEPQEESFACCEMTLSGESCRYTSDGNCDSSYNVMPMQSCEIASFCKVGCCISPDGVCTKQVSKAGCEIHDGYTWQDSPLCEIEQCGLGCCVIGGATCAYSTEKRCSSLEADFPEAEFEFAPSESERACTDICRQADVGCCIRDDGCVWTTRGSCGLEDGSGSYGLYKGQRCSEDRFYEMCGCSTGEETGSYNCLEGDEDVHWMDSCGNDDGVKEDCDYASGTLCGMNDDSEAYCKSVNCESTTPNRNVKSGDRIDDYTGGFRMNGESWCIYDGAVGPTADLVGSRHFLVICENGEEVISPCRDYREEICVQSDLVIGKNTYREGSCQINNGEECTTLCNSQAELKSDDEDELEKAVRKDYYCCKNEERDCYWTGEDHTSGTCLPLIPIGGPFWEAGTDESSQIYQQCTKGDRKCETLWGKDSGTTWDWEIYSGKDCYKEEWFDSSLVYCRALGDCGAHYNYVGEASTEGFRRDYDTPGGKASEYGWTDDAKREPKADDLGSFDTLSESGLGLYGGTSVLEGESIVDFVAKGSAVSDTQKGLQYAAYVIGAVGALLMMFSGVAQIIGIVLAIIAVILYLFTLGSDSKKITVTATCSPWLTPSGGEDCELCDQDPIKPCSEYRCRSLGQRCRFIAENEGSGRESCYAEESSPVRPKISPWLKDDSHPLALISKKKNIEDDYDIEISGADPQFLGGYKIEQEIPSFSRLTFGIETDQLSQCKIAEAAALKDKLSLGITFNDLNLYMPDVYFAKDHNFTISGLSPGKTSRYYIICTNPDGIPPEDQKIPPYVVEFTTDDGPDLTPPLITGFSVPNGGKVKAGSEEFTLAFYVDEVSDYSCKMSEQDKPYDMMEREAACSSVPLDSYFYNEAVCAIELNLTQEGENTFYFRCKDDEGNENSQSTMYAVSMSTPLEITQAFPSGELYTRNVTLQLLTRNGADDGAATCSFDGGGCDMRFFADFYETDSTEHLQLLPNLPKCFYSFDITCHDSVSNYAYSNINFTLTVDTEPPYITSLYEAAGSVRLELSEEATCEYFNSTFSFGSGIVSGTMAASHTLSGMKEYYLQCKDKYSNLMPETTIKM
ncbi:MAG: hypothetical protein ABIB71_01370 [Candidatus Woesearchaeota archaeon]